MCSRSNCLTVLYNLKLGRCFWTIFRVLWQILFPRNCVNLSQCVQIVFRLNFKTFFWQYILSFYLPLQILLSKVFPKEPTKWFVILMAGFRIISLRNEAFWTSIVYCFKPVVQFFHEVYPRTYSIMLTRCLWSLFLIFAIFMRLLLYE